MMTISLLKKKGEKGIRDQVIRRTIILVAIFISREKQFLEKVIVPSIYFQIYFPCSLKTQNIFLKASKTKGDKKKNRKRKREKHVYRGKIVQRAKVVNTLAFSQGQFHRFLLLSTEVWSIGYCQNCVATCFSSRITQPEGKHAFMRKAYCYSCVHRISSMDHYGNIYAFLRDSYLQTHPVSILSLY